MLKNIQNFKEMFGMLKEIFEILKLTNSTYLKKYYNYQVRYSKYKIVGVLFEMFDIIRAR